MNSFKEQVEFFSNKHVRDEPLTDDGLWWVKNDSGSWDGPHTDWLVHREKILTRVKKFDVCVQAGGNLGLYPRLLSSRFKTVYTFEPDPLNFYCLTLNVDSDNVIKINASLGDQNVLVGMNVPDQKNLGMNKTEIGKENSYIPMFKIDQLALKECDLIWLDIEGAEKSALLGAEETIKQFKPLIVIETEEQETRDFLGAFGYDRVDASISDKILEFKG